MKTPQLITTILLFMNFGFGINAQTLIPSYVPTNSLVGWWPFNGNANDLSGNNNNGTVSGATLTTDRYGNNNNAFNFDGLNDYIQVNNSNNLVLSNEFSLIAWVNINGLNTFNAFLSHASNNQTNVSGWVWGYSNFSQPAKRHFQAYPQWNNSTLAQLGNDLISNTWVQIATTYELTSGKLKYYLNGALTDTFVITYSITNSGLNLYIGNHFQNNNPLAPVPTNCSFNGKLDDIGIWSRALSDCEIKKLYHSPSFSATASSATVCSGQSLTLTAGGVANYTWSNGANTASTIVSPMASTVYTVTSTYTTGCSDSKTVAITVNPCTGINELQTELQLSIQPNPNNGEFVIITETSMQIEITDQLGRHLKTIEAKPGENKVYITNLSKGIYLLRGNGNGKMYKGKIMVN